MLHLDWILRVQAFQQLIAKFPAYASTSALNPLLQARQINAHKIKGTNLGGKTEWMASHSPFYGVFIPSVNLKGYSGIFTTSLSTNESAGTHTLLNAP